MVFLTTTTCGGPPIDRPDTTTHDAAHEEANANEADPERIILATPRPANVPAFAATAVLVTVVLVSNMWQMVPLMIGRFGNGLAVGAVIAGLIVPLFFVVQLLVAPMLRREPLVTVTKEAIELRTGRLVRRARSIPRSEIARIERIARKTPYPERLAVTTGTGEAHAVSLADAVEGTTQIEAHAVQWLATPWPTFLDAHADGRDDQARAASSATRPQDDGNAGGFTVLATGNGVHAIVFGIIVLVVLAGLLSAVGVKPGRLDLSPLLFFSPFVPIAGIIAYRNRSHAGGVVAVSPGQLRVRRQTAVAETTLIDRDDVSLAKLKPDDSSEGLLLQIQRRKGPAVDLSVNCLKPSPAFLCRQVNRWANLSWDEFHVDHRAEATTAEQLLRDPRAVSLARPSYLLVAFWLTVVCIFPIMGIAGLVGLADMGLKPGDPIAGLVVWTGFGVLMVALLLWTLVLKGRLGQPVVAVTADSLVFRESHVGATTSHAERLAGARLVRREQLISAAVEVQAAALKSVRLRCRSTDDQPIEPVVFLYLGGSNMLPAKLANRINLWIGGGDRHGAEHSVRSTSSAGSP